MRKRTWGSSRYSPPPINDPPTTKPVAQIHGRPVTKNTMTNATVSSAACPTSGCSNSRPTVAAKNAKAIGAHGPAGNFSRCASSHATITTSAGFTISDG